MSSVAPPGFEWIDVITQLGTAGGFGGLAYYLTCKIIPNMQEKYLNDIKTERTEARAEALSSRTTFANLLESQREQCASELETIRKCFEDRIDALIRGK